MENARNNGTNAQQGKEMEGATTVMQTSDMAKNEPVGVAKKVKEKAPHQEANPPERVADFFATNPLKTEVYETSDGFLFENEPDALTHSSTLENKDVKTYFNGTTKN